MEQARAKFHSLPREKKDSWTLLGFVDCHEFNHEFSICFPPGMGGGGFDISGMGLCKQGRQENAICIREGTRLYTLKQSV